MKSANLISFMTFIFLTSFDLKILVFIFGPFLS